MRKSPIRHNVDSYRRKDGTRVDSHMKGSGIPTSRRASRVIGRRVSSEWKLSPTQLDLLELAMRQGGSLTTREARLNSERIQERHETLVASAKRRGYSSAMSSAGTSFLKRMSRRGLIDTSAGYDDNRPVYRDGSRIWYITDIGRQALKMNE